MDSIQSRADWASSDGYAMAALLVALTVMALLASAALPVYSTLAMREKEQELLFRGNQYVRAIELYQRKFPNVYPPSIDLLVERRFLRKRYQDPVTGGEFVVIHGGVSRMDRTSVAGRSESGYDSQDVNVSGGVTGVMSSSDGKSLARYRGRSRYREWLFTPESQQLAKQTASRWQPSRPPVTPPMFVRAE